MRLRTLLSLSIMFGAMWAVSASAQVEDNDVWSLYVTVGVCRIDLHPTGRTLSYLDSEGETGTVDTDPETAFPAKKTLYYPEKGGWLDATVNHIPGDLDSTPVTKRFGVEPCPQTSTTEPTTTTTVTDSTTTTSQPDQSTTSMVEPTTTTTGSSTTTTKPESTTTTNPTTSSSSVPPTVVTTLPSTLLPEATSSTLTPTSSVPESTTTIPEIQTDLPNTGISVMSLLVAALTLLGSGGVAVWRTR